MATWHRAAFFDELPVGANPTAVVGGAAVNGSAVTFLRSDGAPALGPLTRDLAFGSFKGTGLADPTSAQDAATKAYVDSVAAGLAPKDSVRVATTSAQTLATDFENGDTIDGVTLATGDRVLIKNQVTTADNGVYTVNASGAPTRATDADSQADLLSAFFFVDEGTTNADSGWVQTTNAPIVVGFTSIAFVQFSGAGQITAGAALTKTGNTLDVAVDGSTIEVATDALQVKALGITDAHVAAANKDGTTSTPSLRTLGTGAAQAAAGNDGRLSDARPPSSAAGGTAFDLGAYTNPLKGLALFGYTTAGRPTAVAGGFYRDTDTDRFYFATVA